MIVFPYVESRYRSGKQRPTAIIITPSWTSSEQGAALGLANHWHSMFSPPTTGHYIVDSEMIYRTARDDEVAGAKDSSEKGAIYITVCAEPVHPDNFWDPDTHYLVLRKTAELVVALVDTHKIRTRYLNERKFDQWRWWRNRFRGGIYIDSPGVFPKMDFAAEIERQAILKTLV
jgi:hypothetical protein